MKFFISLISVTISINLCQSYQNNGAFVLITNELMTDIRTRNWLTFTDKDTIVQKKFCYDTLKLQFFMSDETQLYVIHQIRDKDCVLSKRKEFKMFPVLTTVINETLPALKCEISNISVFLLFNTIHETYVLLEGLQSYFIGAVMRSYSYQQSSKEVRYQIWQNLKAITSEINVEEYSKLPVYSLNYINRKKLCVTILKIPSLSERPNEFFQNEGNMILSTKFQKNEFSYLNFPVEFLKCTFLDTNYKKSELHIAQLPNQANRVIILGKQIIDVYDILEFEAGSSSSG